MEPTRTRRSHGALLAGKSTDSQRQKKVCWLCRLVVLALLLLFAGMIAAVYLVERVGFPPRLWAPYIEKRTSGHNPTIVGAGEMVGRFLRTNDRGVTLTPQIGPLRIGAQPTAMPSGASISSAATIIIVKSAAEALSAISHANPGDVITFEPGKYRFTEKYISVNRPGSAGAPIVVRAAQPETVILEFAMVEGFLVSAPHWIFENLTIVGSCESHYHCEHAFHVVGKADHFVARNNMVIDFNSHFKINAMDDISPDSGLIEGNTLTNRSIRESGNPVNVVDLVGANNWIIRKNLITDFFKGGGNRTSFGGFAKGGGHQNMFENNIVLCEFHLHSPGAISIGLSLGGGGTDPAFCRDRKCVTEQDNSTIRGNLVAGCSDDGIYINKAATSKILHNTLIDTGGISVRYAASSVDVEGNLVDGKIRARDDAVLRANDNLDTSIVRLSLGSHPVREFFKGAEHMDFAGSIPVRNAPEGVASPDLCDGIKSPVENKRTAGMQAYGAFADFTRCRR